MSSAKLAVDIVAKEYRVGTGDFNRVALIEQTLVQQQDLQTQSHGEIAQGLIQVYRALGGGWAITQPSGESLATAPLPAEASAEEMIRMPSSAGANIPEMPPAAEKSPAAPLPPK